MLYILCNAIVNTLILSYQEMLMAKTATIQTRVDPKIKRNAQKILGMLNISMSEAISLYLTQITLKKGIPFEIRIPNKITAKTLQESENGKNLRKVSDIDELFEELDR
jgi:DNA-damage-inducible protein J